MAEAFGGGGGGDGEDKGPQYTPAVTELDILDEVEVAIEQVCAVDDSSTLRFVNLGTLLGSVASYLPRQRWHVHCVRYQSGWDAHVHRENIVWWCWCWC